MDPNVVLRDLEELERKNLSTPEAELASTKNKYARFDALLHAGSLTARAKGGERNS
jgi:hypothetical protein